MKGKTPMAIGIIAVIAIIVSIGVGYAAYNGNTYSEDNTMDVTVDRVDLLKDDGEGNYVLLNEKITLPTYSAGSTVRITGYAVATSSITGGVTVRCDMGKSSYWALIDSMQITMSGNTEAFGKVVDQEYIITGVPSNTMPMTYGTQIVISGETLYYCEFTIEIVFSDYTIADDKDFELLSNFTGSSFVFTYVTA